MAERDEELFLEEDSEDDEHKRGNSEGVDDGDEDEDGGAVNEDRHGFSLPDRISGSFYSRQWPQSYRFSLLASSLILDFASFCMIFSDFIRKMKFLVGFFDSFPENGSFLFFIFLFLSGVVGVIFFRF